MLTAFLIYYGLGVITGYVLGEKGRRDKLFRKINDWTKPKKDEAK